MWSKFKKWQKIVLVAIPILSLFILSLGNGWLGSRQGTGTPALIARPLISPIESGKGKGKQILFGDLHVHTTYSVDAFTLSLPLTSGEGSHPPADACDFARFCSALDFWSINDHAEGLTPLFWKQTKEAVRQCNAIAGDPANPDMVTYLGWEWTQVGTTPKNHYGHKNVILLETDEDKVPLRPIAAAPPPGSPLEAMQNPSNFWQRTGIGLAAPVAPGNKPSAYLDATTFFSDVNGRKMCDMSVATKDLPEDCLERTYKPNELFARLKDWQTETIVIPHGTTWGFYTPAGSNWKKQLIGDMHSADVQILFEIFSGHGNSEEYKDFSAVSYNDAGKKICPTPTATYKASCHRAGEIIFERCMKNGKGEDECNKRAAVARQNYIDIGIAGHITVPGAEPQDWLDAGQCTTCKQATFNYRPGGSAQYILAQSNFDNTKLGERPRRYNFGFMASSDNHFARPGTGYKETNRRGFSESIVSNTRMIRKFVPSPSQEKLDYSVAFDPATSKIHRLFYIEAERQASFFTTGGLVAVHSYGRDRNSIWQAMKKKEVYGTTGERILLWFNLINGPNKEDVMGSTVSMRQNPNFKIKVVGSFKQKPGCPTYSLSSLGAEKINRICKGECYNPSNERYLIEKVEIIRVQPQQVKDEPVKELIQDPYYTKICPKTQAGCQFTFKDKKFSTSKRDAVYYIRVIQESHDIVNGAQLNCIYDKEGNCIKTRPCDAASDASCLAKKPELAWSSPIYINYGKN